MSHSEQQPVPGCHCHGCTSVCHNDIAGHFISADHCRFLLHNGTERYCVSTVGDYWPPGANRRCEVSWDGLYETMVFDKRQDEDRWTALTVRSYHTEEQARTGHAELLAEWSAEGKAEGEES